MYNTKCDIINNINNKPYCDAKGQFCIFPWQIVKYTEYFAKENERKKTSIFFSKINYINYS